MPRQSDPSNFRNADQLPPGITPVTLQEALNYVYSILDSFDESLDEESRFADLIEVTNLSSVIGNLLTTGIIRYSAGLYKRAAPHKYQDLRAVPHPQIPHENVEVKIALEGNAPKSHLAKSGLYLVCRYVLGDAEGNYIRGERGNVAWIWEVRLGRLEPSDFNLSSTEGDSGKTAVVKAASLQKMTCFYFDKDRCPYAPRSKIRKQLEEVWHSA